MQHFNGNISYDYFMYAKDKPFSQISVNFIEKGLK